MTRFRIALPIALILFAVSCRKETSIPAQPTPGTGAPSQTVVTDPSAAPADGTAKVGSVMPAWTAKTLDGKAFDIADMRGSVVLINIWATWCGPCRYEIPELVKLHAEWAPQGFAVLGASIDGRATVGEVEPMMRSFKINYPVVIDTDARIADIFETSVIPTSALIDRNGRVVWTRIGTLHADDAEMVAAIRAALASPRT
ncbi:MAG: TlpA family protein disulfide reductase [Thermoanaerobaculia bacterium]